MLFEFTFVQRAAAAGFRKRTPLLQNFQIACSISNPEDTPLRRHSPYRAIQEFRVKCLTRNLRARELGQPQYKFFNLLPEVLN